MLSCVILDEANAPLDQRSEALLIEALKSLRGQMTILMISYRPSLLKVSDHLLEVADGRVTPVEPEAPRETPASEVAAAGADTVAPAPAPARPFSISGKLTA